MPKIDKSEFQQTNIRFTKNELARIEESANCLHIRRNDFIRLTLMQRVEQMEQEAEASN